MNISELDKNLKELKDIIEDDSKLKELKKLNEVIIYKNFKKKIRKKCQVTTVSCNQ